MARSRKTAAIMKKMKKQEEEEERAALQQAKDAERDKVDAEGEEEVVEDEKDVEDVEKEAEEEEEAKEEKEAEEEAEEDEEADEEEEEAEEDEEDADGNCTSGSEKRKRASPDKDIDLHYVSAIKKHHASWKAFETYLKEYSSRVSTKMEVKETLNVSLHNRKLRKQKQYKGCAARFPAQAYERADGAWGIEVKRDFYGHNHHVSDEIFQSHPGIPQAPKGSPVMRDVELMVDCGGKASRIYDYIRSNTVHRVAMTDVHNMIRRIKQSGSELSDEDQVAEPLVNFNMSAEGNVSTVNENARGQTAVVSISSELMRNHYSRFPELLLVDCTHKTKRNRYQLCTLMAMDQFGNGQPVQHYVIERNPDWHMVKVTEHFQVVNEWERTQVVMVDKDLKEVEVLERLLPRCRILMCHFHVIKWLKKAVRDDKKYGTYPSEVLKQMDFCVHNMVYSKTESELHDNAGEFKTLTLRTERNELWDYFDKNWMACQGMWVDAYRLHLPHFHNNTINRLESFFGKLKVDLDSSFSMVLCLSTILNFQRRKEDAYNMKTPIPGSTRNANYGEEMNQLLGMTTEWVTNVFFEEYQFATNPDTMQHYTFIETDNTVTVVRGDRRHHVDKASLLCDCEFSDTLKLPCRHVVLYRKHTGMLMSIPYASIQSRWLRAGSLDAVLPTVDLPLRVFTSRDEVARKKQMTEKDKFKRAQNVLGRISSELTEFTDDRFERAIGNLEAWWDGLREGKTEVVTEDKTPTTADDDSQVEPTELGNDDSTEADEEENNSNVHGGSPLPVPLKLKPLNARAPKVGRLRLVRADADSKRHAEQKSYNQGKPLRKALRDKGVMEVVEYIQIHKPSLGQLQSFLDTFEVRFKRHTEKKMTAESRAAGAAQALPSRLPQALVTMAIEAIQKANGSMFVDLSRSHSDKDAQWIATTEGAGAFSEQQLQAMYYLGDLANTCKHGSQCYSRLMTSIDPMAAERNQVAGDTEGGETEAYTVAKELLKTWPHTSLPGFGFPLEWSNIYCAREKTWYNELIIEAFTKTLAARYANNKTIFLPQTQLPHKRVGGRVPVAIRSALEIATKDYVFLPINFNMSHWACIVVDNVKGMLMCYDSVDKRTNQKHLQAVATEIINTTLTGFAQTTIHSPTQRDSDSCGLFICLFFWKRLWIKAGSDYTHLGLRWRRWEVLRAAIKFSKEQGEEGVTELE